MKKRIMVDLYFDTDDDADLQKEIEKAAKDAEKKAKKSVHGTVKIHDCYHDEDPNTPCQNEEKTAYGNGGDWEAAEVVP